MILTEQEIEFTNNALNSMRGINSNTTLNELRVIFYKTLSVGMDISTLNIKSFFSDDEIKEIKLMIANYVQTAIAINQRLEAKNRKPTYTTSYILKTISAIFKKPLGI